MANKAGMKDIAEALGISTAAVSYALSGKGSVSPDTRDKVRRMARRLGYSRNVAAVTLRTGRSNLLGAIVHDTSNPYFAMLLRDFEESARKAGYLTIVANSKDDISLQDELVNAFLSQGVAGLLISPVHGTSATGLAPLKKAGRPYVVCVRDIGDEKASYVGQDDARAGFVIADHMLDRGNTGFAFVGGFQDTLLYKNRKRGIRQALRKRGLTLPQEMVFPCPPTHEEGERTVAKLLRLRPGCKALIAHNDNVASGAYAAINAAGMAVGRDFSVAGMDNIPIGAILTPPLTTVELHPYTIGKLSAEELINALADKRPKPSRRMVEPMLIERRSVDDLTHR